MSATKLTVENAASLIDAVERFGDMVAESKMFGCKSPAQGRMMVFMAFSEGLPITELRRRFHIVGAGELAMKADYMRSEIRRLGHDFDWVDMGDKGDKAVIRLIINLTNSRKEVEVTYTIDDAKRAKLVKPDSNWDKNPSDMLRARATTKAVRAYIPEILSGYYTEDEYEDGIIDANSTVVEPPQKFVVPKLASTESSVGIGPPSWESPTVVPNAPHDALSDAQGEPLATGDQITTVQSLFSELKVPADDQLKAIQKRGARDMGSLTVAGADDIIASLSRIAEAKRKETIDSTSGESKVDQNATVAKTNGPCVETQISQIRSLLEQLCQYPEHKDIGSRYRAKLQSQGLTRTNDLSMTEADLAIESFSKRNLAAFFDAELKGHSPKNG